MPGSVLATQVAAGAKVAKGDLLVILEAMKMEHRITAPRDGVVESVHVSEGEQVENAQLLVTLTATEGE
jgi:biotin carboxyl carrier protein